MCGWACECPQLTPKSPTLWIWIACPVTCLARHGEGLLNALMWCDLWPTFACSTACGQCVAQRVDKGQQARSKHAYNTHKHTHFSAAFQRKHLRCRPRLFPLAGPRPPPRALPRGAAPSSSGAREAPHQRHLFRARFRAAPLRPDRLATMTPCSQCGPGATTQERAGEQSLAQHERAMSSSIEGGIRGAGPGWCARHASHSRRHIAPVTAHAARGGPAIRRG